MTQESTEPDLPHEPLTFGEARFGEVTFGGLPIGSAPIGGGATLGGDELPGAIMGGNDVPGAIMGGAVPKGPVDVVPPSATPDGFESGSIVIEPPSAKIRTTTYPPPVTISARDPDGVLAATSAAIARGVPNALIPQVRDVRGRMKRLSDTAADPGVRRAAMQAELALDTVLDFLGGELNERQAHHAGRTLVVLALDLAEVGLLWNHPGAVALFKSGRLIGRFVKSQYDRGGSGRADR